MDIYESIMDYFSGLPLIEAWPEMSTLFARSAARRPRHWRLPVLACEAVGGKPDQATSAVVAIGCLHISILLIDDMLDEDPRGEHFRLGTALTSNLAAAFQAIGLEAVAHSEIQSLNMEVALRSLNQMMLTTAVGQYLDIQNKEGEAAYWAVVEKKSSPFFASALYTGALLGGANTEIAEKIKQIGQIYGEMIQIHDDLNDVLSVPANQDWTLGRMPLPILFASIVDHPERDQFLRLRQALPDSDALAAAQNILIRCGAVSYCLDQLIRRFKVATRILTMTPLVRRDGVENLLNEIIAPVSKLFAVTGIRVEKELTKFLPLD